MPFDPNDLKTAFDLFRGAIGLVKDTKDLLPSKEQQTTLVSSLDAAEHATHIAEAQIAKALDYQLCQCTFPPQIMLSKGYDTRSYSTIEIFECPKCGKEWPPEQPDMPPPAVVV